MLRGPGMLLHGMQDVEAAVAELFARRRGLGKRAAALRTELCSVLCLRHRDCQ